jgi:dolichyl-phosphate-mannose--protein O-mannosyl transferase
VTFWLGLLSIPLLAVVGWHERRKSYLLLVAVYLFEWLPWAISPRKLTFEYHFFPNVAIIMIANALIFQRLTQWLFKLWNEGERQYVRLVCALLLSPIVGALGYIGFSWFSATGMADLEKKLTNADLILFVTLVALLAAVAWLLYAFLSRLTSSKEAPVYLVIGAFSVLTLLSFAFFYPITAGVPLHWADWDARMLTPLMNNMWINPHPGQ